MFEQSRPAPSGEYFPASVLTGEALVLSPSVSRDVQPSTPAGEASGVLAPSTPLGMGELAIGSGHDVSLPVTLAEDPATVEDSSDDAPVDPPPASANTPAIVEKSIVSDRTNDGGTPPPTLPPTARGEYEDDDRPSFGLERFVDRTPLQSPQEGEMAARTYRTTTDTVLRDFWTERQEGRDHHELAAEDPEGNWHADITVGDDRSVHLTLRDPASGETSTHDYTIERKPSGKDNAMRTLVYVRDEPSSGMESGDEGAAVSQAESRLVGFPEAQFVSDTLRGATPRNLTLDTLLDGTAHHNLPDRLHKETQEAMLRKIGSDQAAQEFQAWCESFRTDPPSDWTREGNTFVYDGTTGNGETITLTLGEERSVDGQTRPTVSIDHTIRWEAVETGTQELIKEELLRADMTKALYAENLRQIILRRSLTYRLSQDGLNGLMAIQMVRYELPSGALGRPTIFMPWLGPRDVRLLKQFMQNPRLRQGREGA